MLVIRNAQLAAFAAHAVQRFEDEMVAHSGGGEAVRHEVKEGMAMARGWGLRDESSVRTFLEWRHEFGPNFHLEERHRAIREILEDPMLAGFAKIQRIRPLLKEK